MNFTLCPSRYLPLRVAENYFCHLPPLNRHPSLLTGQKFPPPADDGQKTPNRHQSNPLSLLYPVFLRSNFNSSSFFTKSNPENPNPNLYVLFWFQTQPEIVWVWNLHNSTDINEIYQLVLVLKYFTMTDAGQLAIDRPEPMKPFFPLVFWFSKDMFTCSIGWIMKSKQNLMWRWPLLAGILSFWLAWPWKGNLRTFLFLSLPFSSVLTSFVSFTW